MSEGLGRFPALAAGSLSVFLAVGLTPLCSPRESPWSRVASKPQTPELSATALGDGCQIILTLSGREREGGQLTRPATEVWTQTVRLGGVIVLLPPTLGHLALLGCPRDRVSEPIPTKCLEAELGCGFRLGGQLRGLTVLRT